MKVGWAHASVAFLIAGCGGRVASVDGNDAVSAALDDASIDASPLVPDAVVLAETAPVEPRPDAGCRHGSSGSSTGSECKNDETVRASIAKTCAPTGIRTLEFREPCGVFNFSAFTCCKADGTDCTPLRRDGSSSSCKDTDTWRRYAELECERTGKVVGTFTTDSPCGPGGHRANSWSCCSGI